MPRGVEHRDISPVLQKLRNIFRGRQIRKALRFADECAARTQPPPNVPGGPYHKTSKIYYYARDARREVEPPLLVASLRKQIGSGSAPPALTKPAYPGNTYLWDK